MQVVVRVAHLTADAHPTGCGLQITARVDGLQLARYDANSSKPAWDRVTLQPLFVKPLLTDPTINRLEDTYGHNAE